jgi:hypothetical protein
VAVWRAGCGMRRVGCGVGGVFALLLLVFAFTIAVAIVIAPSADLINDYNNITIHNKFSQSYMKGERNLFSFEIPFRKNL